MSSISESNRAWKAEGEKRREKQEQSRNIPSRFQGGRVVDMYIMIMGGNTLDTGEDGCKWSSDIITELDADYDPNTDDSFQDGICRGRLFIDGEEQDDKVLCANEGSAFGHALRGENDDTDGPDKVWAFRAVSKPVAGGGSKTVYRLG